MKILNYKRPEFWGILASTVFCLFIALCLLNNSKPEVTPENVTTETSETVAGESLVSETVNSENQENDTAFTHLEEFNGFRASTFDNGDGELTYIYRYHRYHGIEAEDFSICMDSEGLNSTIYYNGQVLDINTYGHFYDNDIKGHTIPYLIDVTGDGQEELILEYASPDPSGVPYLIYKCYVYRLNTMEQLTFDADTAELSQLMIFTPKAYNAETHELTYQAEYDVSIHANLIPHDRKPWENTAVILPKNAEYWQNTQYAYMESNYESLYFDQIRNCFVGEFPVYLDATKSHPYYPFYVEYIWDETSGSFIMDLSTARIPAAG